MASKASATVALFLALNLVMCDMVFSSDPYPPLSQCPKDTLKLNLCANVLNLIGVNIGKAQKEPCCSLIGNLIRLKLAACLCTAVHANVLGILNLDVNIALSALVNKCGHRLPKDFTCPPL